MAATSRFASQYKRDLSTETLRTKVARRKSMLQKENRHKLFEKGRQFGLADVNVQLSKERGISQLNETSETCFQENRSVKQSNFALICLQQLKEECILLLIFNGKSLNDCFVVQEVKIPI
uniref:IBB domain-containing protein n=1 Tax=Buteo japonicus TaxID=224669 RepID=A0A8C0B6E0_9AVES